MATSAATFLPLVTATMTPQSVEPAEQLNSGVQVVTDKSHYRFGDTILVTVANMSSVAIVAQSGQTFCTIISAEKKIDDQWQSLRRCPVGAPPGFVRIPQGGQLAVELAPPDPSTPHLEPGTYRLVFRFRIESAGGNATPSPWQSTYSKEFVIRD